MDMSNDLMIVAIILSLLSLVLLYRVFRGPQIIDRVVAADCIDIILGVVLILFGCIEERSLFVDLGLIMTLLGFIGTVLISKYLEGKI
ncbi:MAG: monovalent cation/H+ antiporter complex subunit F [Clostridium sp.]|uniref:monovalent cation/H+ antiporter complex subunit F n=1 Tax=Clostridium sp. TaxID=1506 RepID=UPI0029040112|nr:monovalent cation/H+ antiporter complex subunit F [Clostridium sp.]MDU1075399.1 monovalent cation/H+ antiporter complex subunit F [Clostridium sp.]MDU1125578.1 monovalent cation/H+ antiporter complex subunit F [Clostridium sp.]MDU3676505.1 monovalent cation/H+ antiporter complex subunit F [Clostridium sp.]MDU6873763.1 monovalent cation/H+ antiporter complex subunit F [Clostridium sp.]MDU6934790.1 monovalent cation/H+ antiporter complex subunit F [Clostridium sp.]